ncbi:Gag-polypeptide of LTR copia-type [Sesbania bispinosa]|nr:Gag-polypeptide of LTR copia-type [Sesbania bispinosa]
MADQAKDPTQDVSNPLFLHHSDGPDLVLTSQPLDHKNYTTWSRAMQVALSVKNKLAFVDGTLPKPPATDPTFAAWTRANNVAWIISAHIIPNSSKFGKELSNYKPTFQCTCGGLQQLQSFTESDYVMSFSMGLNDSFSQIHGQILISDPLPSISNVFSLVLQEEAQREIVATFSPSVVPSDNIAFAVNTSQSATSRSKFTKKERPRTSRL